jgi:hypothetical protein
LWHWEGASVVVIKVFAALGVMAIDLEALARGDHVGGWGFSDRITWAWNEPAEPQLTGDADVLKVCVPLPLATVCVWLAIIRKELTSFALKPTLSKPLSFDTSEYETSTANGVFVPVTALAGLMLVMLILSTAGLVSDDLEPHANKHIETIIPTTIRAMIFFILISPFKVQWCFSPGLLAGVERYFAGVSQLLQGQNTVA